MFAILIGILFFGQETVQIGFQQFLFNHAIIISIFSFVFQILLAKYLLYQHSGASTWTYIGSYDSFVRLRACINLTRVPVDLNSTSFKQIQVSEGPFVVEGFSKVPSTCLQDLSTQRSKGISVLSEFKWCEIFLQRLPIHIISIEDVLSGEFKIKNSSFEFRLKRLGDILVSLVLLLLTLPLIVLAALFIKLQDNGPAFYTQTRTGLHGRPFKIVKLRTMSVDAENNGPQWSSISDQRVTKLGGFLRKARIDELPQLVCVLSGSMSLIGPRPERPEFCQELSKSIIHYNLRHDIRPGLSGWAQVNYPYGASTQDSENKLSYDLYYLRNFSFLLDLLILFKTIRLVLNAKGSLPTSKPNQL